MRIAAILFIVLALGANFYFNNLTSLAMAMLSFPVLIWVLLRRRKKTVKQQLNTPASLQEEADR